MASDLTSSIQADHGLKQGLIEKIEDRSALIGVVGLGYVGLPFAVEKCKVGFNVVGIEQNPVRKAQIAKILSDATHKGAAGLRGKRAVRLDLRVVRFHALTFEAEAKLSNSGVHNIDFFISAVDAKTGEVLAGPTLILAATPALAGVEMVEARNRGETQKIHISQHVTRVIAGWLGIGPDPRGQFTRLGA